MLLLLHATQKMRSLIWPAESGTFMAAATPHKQEEEMQAAIIRVDRKYASLSLPRVRSSLPLQGAPDAGTDTRCASYFVRLMSGLRLQMCHVHRFQYAGQPCFSHDKSSDLFPIMHRADSA